MFSNSDKKFFYFDSINNANIKHAKDISKKLSKYIGPNKLPIHEICTPQQLNTDDCGIYLILITELILSKLILFKFKFNISDLKIYNFKQESIFIKRSLLAFLLNQEHYSSISNDLFGKFLLQTENNNNIINDKTSFTEGNIG